jgi:hypothetical protein
MNIRNILLFGLLIWAILLTTGCTNAERAKWGSLGGKHKITLYSGGIAVRVWHSTGYIKNEEHSDGYYFEDDLTHKLVTISGEVAIEQE